MIKKLTLFLSLFWVISSAFAQVVSSDKETSSLFLDDTEIFISFEIADRSELFTLSSIVDISRVKDNRVFAYVSEKQLQQFILLGKEFEVLPYPRPVNPKMFGAEKIGDSKQGLLWDSYPTYQAYEAMMQSFVNDYPALCRIDTILDPTPNNHRLLVLKITDNPDTDEDEPEFLYSSSMHGNELTGYVLMLRLADHLLSNYGTNSRVTNLVNNCEIWICPLANPDGTYKPSDTDISQARRGNNNYNSQTGSYFDLNRNYPDPRTGMPTTYGPIQPETQAFMDFAISRDFNMAANFHDGVELVNFPWDTWTGGSPNNHPHPDDEWWQRISRMYADSAQLFAGTSLGSGYFDDEDNGITNGGDWYVITGGRQDYMNYFHQCREVTIELSVSQPPQGSTLPLYWNAHFRPLMKYMEESLYGIRGLVTDSCTGQGIRARVYVNGHEVLSDSSFVYSSLPAGNYHRYLINGNYSVTYSAPGYTSKTINNISVVNGQASIHHVTLRPTAAPAVNFTADVTSSCNGLIQFTNLTSGSTGNASWDFGDGTTSSQWNPQHQYTGSGTYTVSLSVSNCIGNDTEVKTSYITVELADPYNLVNDSSCNAAVLNLAASGNGQIQWYDAPSGGNLLHTGNSYTTPLLTTSEIYYVEDVIQKPLLNAGKSDNSGGGGYTATGNRELIFDAYTPFILESVTIYGNPSSTPGNKTIELLNAGGSVIATSNHTITSGTNVVTLNYSIPAAGAGYRLRTDAANLFRNNAGVNYPYTTPSVLSVTGSSAGNQYYYSFYDWRVREPACISGREAVYAVILGQPVAGFTPAVNNNTVIFSNNSVYGVNFSWNFGDGNTSSISDPVHIYSGTGQYTVTLIVSNACGSDTTTQTVTITAVSSAGNDNVFSSINIYPNPASNVLFVETGEKAGQKMNVAIYSLSGKMISQQDFANEKVLSINVGDIVPGMYILKISSETGNVCKRLLIGK